VSESGSTSGVNGPWLDMSAYPNLPPEDAVEGRVLDTLRTVLRAPEVTPPSPDAWDRAVQAAVAGRPPGHDHQAVAHDGLGHDATGHGGDDTDTAGHDGTGHVSAGGEEEGTAAEGWQTGWHGGQAGGLETGGTYEDGRPGDAHDPHNGGDHW
jgi:hypothetical protein